MKTVCVATGDGFARLVPEDQAWQCTALLEGSGIRCLAVDPQDADCWYVSAAPGPAMAHRDDRDAQAQIYCWRGAGPWRYTDLAQPLNSFPYALAFYSSGLVAGFRDGRIFGSDLQGGQWRQIELTGHRLLGVRAMEASSATR